MGAHTHGKLGSVTDLPPAKDFGSIVLVDHIIYGLSFLSFLPLGIPDKENVSSCFPCLASINCHKVKHNHGDLPSKGSSPCTVNRAVNILLILLWHLG